MTDKLIEYHRRIMSAEKVNVIRETSLNLLYCVVENVTQIKNPLRKKTPYDDVMIHIVNEARTRHELVFKDSIEKLQGELVSNVVACFNNVIDGMFKDHQCNWGRIIAFYAFVGCIAQYYKQQNMGLVFTDVLIDAADAYAVKHFVPWIVEHGGWDAFAETFPSPPSMLWYNIYYLCGAIGAGAIVFKTYSRLH